MKYDAQQLAITTDDDNAINIINDFVNDLLSFDANTPSILDAAKHYPDCAMIQVYAAITFVYAQSKHDALFANAYLDQALTEFNDLTPREQLWVEAIQASLENRFDDAITLYQSIGEQWPTDILTGKLIEFHCFETGNSKLQLAFMKTLEAANPDNPHVLAMLAFAYEINEKRDRCIEIANHAIQVKPDNAWAYHALAHAYTNEGQYKNAIRVMRESEAIWSQGNQYIQSHMAFHLAVVYVTELDFDSALQIYHRYVWDKQPNTVVEQTDAILLLWYIELAGHNPGSEWQKLVPHIETRAREFNFPFLNILYIYALARAGEEKKAKQSLLAMQQFAAKQRGRDADRWQQHGLPLANACLAFAEQDFQQASELFADVYSSSQAGGSDEQRGVFWQTYLTCLMQSEQTTTAKQLLAEQVCWRKNHSPLEKLWHQQLGDSADH